jgi:glycosyltransferase involved in cell wall biosynthesis
MNIVFFRHSLLNRGGDKMVVQYANYLTSRGHDVSILTNITNTLFKVQAKIINISRRKGKSATIALALFKKIDCDIIISDIIAMTFLLSWRNKQRLVYFAQDYDVFYYKNSLQKTLIKLLYWLCLGVLKIPVIAVSRELGQLMRSMYNTRVDIVQNGVDTTVFYPERSDLYLSLKQKSQVLLVFSRSDYRKGYDVAVQTILHIMNDLTKRDVEIWMVGETIATPFPVRHFGFVSSEELRKILSSADVLLYPSRHEGLPLFVLEAMACRCPVVTTDAVGFVRHNVDAMQAPIGDIMKLAENLYHVLTDDKLKNRIAQAGLETARSMSLNDACAAFERTLVDLHSIQA